MAKPHKDSEWENWFNIISNQVNGINIISRLESDVKWIDYIILNCSRILHPNATWLTSHKSCNWFKSRAWWCGSSLIILFSPLDSQSCRRSETPHQNCQRTVRWSCSEVSEGQWCSPYHEDTLQASQGSWGNHKTAHILCYILVNSKDKYTQRQSFSY